MTLEPGQPGARPHLSPGTVVLSPETYRAVLTDMPASLKTQGFTDIVLLGDSGGNLKPMQEVAETLNASGRGQAPLRTSMPEYYNYAEVEKFEEDVLGIHEKLEGCHDDYYISVDYRGARPQRHPHARAEEGGQVRDQRRQPRAAREDDRERQEDRRVPDRKDGRRDQEGNGGQAVKRARE